MSAHVQHQPAPGEARLVLDTAAGDGPGHARLFCFGKHGRRQQLPQRLAAVEEPGRRRGRDEDATRICVEPIAFLARRGFDVAFKTENNGVTELFPKNAFPKNDRLHAERQSGRGPKHRRQHFGLRLDGIAAIKDLCVGIQRGRTGGPLHLRRLRHQLSRFAVERRTDAGGQEQGEAQRPIRARREEGFVSLGFSGRIHDRSRSHAQLWAQ